MALGRSTRHMLLAAVFLCAAIGTVWSSKLISHHLLGSSDGWSSFSSNDRSNPAWFLAHPILAIVGSVTLPVPAVILRKYKGYWSKKVHAYFFVIAIVALLGSIYIAFTSKSAKGKDHLVSYHARSGALLFAGYILTAVSGVIALDPDFAFISDKTRKTFLKWLHKSGGRVLVVFGIWVCFSGWVKFFSSTNMYVGLLVAIVSSVLTFIDPITSRLYPEPKSE